MSVRELTLLVQPKQKGKTMKRKSFNFLLSVDVKIVGDTIESKSECKS